MSDEQQGGSPGGFISQKKAIKELNQFFSYRENLDKKNNVPWNPDSSFYAYQFGLDKMQQLMDKIAAWNKDNPDNLIGGVRVYSSIKNDNGVDGSDVFLIPYLANTNKDYIPVDKYFDNNGEEIEEQSDDDGGMILNEGRRCPPRCA